MSEDAVEPHLCVFCEVMNVDEDEVGVWCRHCMRPILLKWC